MLFAQKRSLVKVDKAEEDGAIITQSGSIPVKVGDMVASDQFGNSYVMSEDDLYTNYEPVRKIKKTRSKSKSPFELAYAEQLANFSLESNEESSDYIEETRKLIKNKTY